MRLSSDDTFLVQEKNRKEQKDDNYVSHVWTCIKFTRKLQSKIIEKKWIKNTKVVFNNTMMEKNKERKIIKRDKNLSKLLICLSLLFS